LQCSSVGALAGGPARFDIEPPDGYHVRHVPIPGLAKEVVVFERDSLADQSDAFIRGEHSENVDPFGQVLWPAAAAASTVLSDRASRQENGLSGLCILEAGAGLGLCSLTASCLGASRVIATDASVIALNLLGAAAGAQALEVECQVWDFVKLSWEACSLSLQSDAPHKLVSMPILIVAADVLYSEELADSLALRFVEICQSGGQGLVTDSVCLYTGRFEDKVRKMAPDLKITSSRATLSSWDAIPVAKAGVTREYDAEVTIIRLGSAWDMVHEQ